MRVSFLLAVILSLMIIPSGFAAKQKPCRDTAMAQFELNNCASDEMQKAEAQMQEVYRRILRKNQSDTAFVRSLEAAQKAWEAFRDAELKAVFPDSDSRKYGTVYPMCFAAWRAELTRQRTKQLMQWLIGIPEGDVCTGSIPVKQEPTGNEAGPGTKKQRDMNHP